MNRVDCVWGIDSRQARRAISLHSHLGPRSAGATRRARQSALLWGLNVFGHARGVLLEGGDDALHARPHPPVAGDAAVAGKRTKRRGAQHSTDDLPRAALDAGPTQLKDVSAADVARRTRSGSTASQGRADTPVETDHEPRTRCKERKEMRRLAAALAEALHTPTEFEGFPGSRAAARLGVGVGRRRMSLWEKSPTSACPNPGPKRANRNPDGPRRASPAPLPPPSRLRRRARRLSRTGCAISPLHDSGVEFSAFAVASAEDDLDGTPGGFDSNFGVEAEAEPEVLREALPSPGLSRGAGGLWFGGGGGKEMGGF
ncbi:hypothetical protein B0H14DRAFT_3759249 [Mycena olivaceomarginata]|nr:hypothetical protein B0H14DRAFT_3759249 [Mycena olivaceomarginata]